MSDISRKKFGGGWSDEKLDALRSYVTSYIQALSQTSFERVYIDAFAGAGTREVLQNTEEELFDESLLEEETSYRHGSPLIALGFEPSFQRYVFIERDAKSLAKLQEEVAGNFPSKINSVEFRQGDANELLQGTSKNRHFQMESFAGLGKRSSSRSFFRSDARS